MRNGELAKFGASVDFCERGDLFVLSGVSGTDPSTGRLVEAPAEQFAQAFRNLVSLSDQIGLSLDEIGRLTVLTPDPAYRPLINGPWTAHFPGENRPARKTTHAPLASGSVVELDIVGARTARVPIEVEGIRHEGPIPVGARVGRYVYSSVITAVAPDGSRPVGPDAIHQAFANMQHFIEGAGGSLDDLSNVWAFLGLWELSSHYAETWSRTFTNDESRPSRKSYYYPYTDIQLECEAVLGGPRRNIEIPNAEHSDPIPLGCITGGVLTSSGIGSRDPDSGANVKDAPSQAKNCVANLARLMEQAGLAKETLFHVIGLVQGQEYVRTLYDAWCQYYPAGEQSPVFQAVELGLTGREERVQLFARAFAG